MTGLFLSAEERVELTGYRRNADQRKWLTHHGWMFEANAAGVPVISRVYAEGRLGGKAIITSAEPDFSHIRKAA
jgi:hypothetical protein